MVLTPEDKAVVEPEGEDPGSDHQPPVAAGSRQADATDRENAPHRERREREAQAGERERRDILQAELDEQPRRSPHDPKKKPDPRRSFHADLLGRELFAELKGYSKRNATGNGLSLPWHPLGRRGARLRSCY